MEQPQQRELYAVGAQTSEASLCLSLPFFPPSICLGLSLSLSLSFLSLHACKSFPFFLFQKILFSLNPLNCAMKLRGQKGGRSSKGRDGWWSSWLLGATKGER